ncbi:MAG: RNA polymerase sigma factor region1.1 domain-containing protein [Planctomycetes bacterium]|nr:RNA polymerase sigma factor region1.1 domain-containing protein [Planctomycetota bacterium]
MASFKKAVLRIGKYFSPDGEVPVTRERLHHWRDEFHRMKAARQVVPIDWDHAEQTNRDGLTPLSLGDFRKRRSARNTVGHLVDFDVTSDGAILTLDVPDDDAAKKADKNLIFVSPVVSPVWRDGAANEYADCITHVDFVNHPVDHSQGPFERVPVETVNQQPAIACALRMGLGTQFYVPTNKGTNAMATKDKIIVRMGSDDPADGFFTKGGETFPITVGGEDGLNKGHEKAGKYAKKRGGGSRGKRKKGRKAASMLSLIRMAEGETDQVAEVIPEDDYDSIDEILDMLEEFNIRLPDDTDDENLIERLRTALHTAMAHREDGEVEEEGEMLELPEAEEAPPVEETAQALSLATARAVAGQYRKSLGTRLKKLTDTGRCTPEEATAKRSELSTVKLSLAASGRPCKVEVDRWITSREAIPEGTFWTESQRLSLANHATAEDPEKLQALQKMIFRGR